MLYNCAIGVVFLSVLLCNVESAEEPLVTLKHGGQLQGITYPVGEQKVDHFVSKLLSNGLIQTQLVMPHAV